MGDPVTGRLFVSSFRKPPTLNYCADPDERRTVLAPPYTPAALSNLAAPGCLPYYRARVEDVTAWQIQFSREAGDKHRKPRG